MPADQQSNNLPPPMEDIIPLTIFQETGCCPTAPAKAPEKATPSEASHRAGCMVCGAELVYFGTNQDSACYYCGLTLPGNAACINSHFVCDRCHSANAVEVVRQVCLHNTQTDLVALMQTIRSHPRFRIHGPEHHALVPAVILTALRNCGQPITDEQIVTAIER